MLEKKFTDSFTLSPKAFFSLIALAFCSFVFLLSKGSFAQESKSAPQVIETKVSYEQVVLPPASLVKETKVPNESPVVFDEQKLLEISRNLRNAIDENKDLQQENEKVLEDVKQLRGQHEVDATKLNAMSQERDELKRLLDESSKAAQEQSQKLKELQAAMDQRTQEWESKLKKAQDQLALQEKLNEDMANMKLAPPPPTEAAPEATSLDAAGVQRVFSQMDDLHKENDQLKTESAKVHYNMGNLFFKQGEYAKAAAEYRQSVELMPYDSSNHYNLAFVCGEFLDDPETALRHYQQYLFLNPNAKDINFVKEKILKARMALQALIDSPLEQSRNRINDTSY